MIYINYGLIILGLFGFIFGLTEIKASKNEPPDSPRGIFAWKTSIASLISLILGISLFYI